MACIFVLARIALTRIKIIETVRYTKHDPMFKVLLALTRSSYDKTDLEPCTALMITVTLSSLSSTIVCAIARYNVGLILYKYAHHSHGLPIGSQTLEIVYKANNKCCRGHSRMS